MSTLWIVHRDPRARAALARLAGAGDDSVLGSPGDAHFQSLEAPEAVLLGLSGDLELELEFAHRCARRLARSAWLLVAEPGDLAEAARLFDSVAAEVLPWPPAPEALRRRLAALRARRRVEPLSERHSRDALAERFSRAFAGLELPELLRALDPHLAGVPLLVRGEPGTGRTLLARYVHVFGGTTGGAFLAFDCRGAADLSGLRRALERAVAQARAPSALTICLEDVDRLPPAAQRELAAWIELAPPAEALRFPRLRFLATADDPESAQAPDLEPELQAALSTLCVRIPPLRRRAHAIGGIAQECADAWCRARGERPRRLAPDTLAVLADHPWPGNLRELEAVVARTLAATRADPVGPSQLRFEAVPPEPSAAVPPAAIEVEPGEAGGEVEVEARPEPGEEVEPSGAREAEVVELVPEILPEPELAEEPGPAAEPPPEPAAAPPPAPRPEPQPARPPSAASPAELGAMLRRLAGAVATEVRNPLVAIRTFAALLPERFSDDEFRLRFAASVGEDVKRLEEVMTRLAHLGALEPARNVSVDVAALLDELLEARREALQRRRVLVLKELDHERPFALADPAQLRLALDCLIDKALALVPERGDAYVASRYHPSGLRGGPAVRVLARFQGPAGADRAAGLSAAGSSLDLVAAEVLVRAQGGTVSLDSSEAGETVALIDLPAPARAGPDENRFEFG
jgi:DNA-binding NtrC family response regulator